MASTRKPRLAGNRHGLFFGKAGGILLRQPANPQDAPERYRVHPALSAAVLLILFAALWVEFSAKEHLDALFSAFVLQLQQANWWWLGGALLLVPFNWLAETKKWYQFIRHFEPLSIGRALLAVWVGVSFSLFTPNRVGEYGGRILLLQPESRWKAAIANVVGNFSQYLVLLTAGAWGSYLFFSRYWTSGLPWLKPFGWVAVPGLTALYVLYFNIGSVLPLLRRVPFPGRLRFVASQLEVLHYFDRKELTGLLGWAFLRYAVYTTQYYLLLHFFGINTGFTAGYAAIATIFLVQTSLPLPPVAGLLARGNLAVQIWSVFGANEISSLAATFTLWIINLILPALIGTFSLFYVNIAKSPAHEAE